MRGERNVLKNEIKKPKEHWKISFENFIEKMG